MRLLVLALSVLFAANAASSSHHPEEFLNSIRGKNNEGRQIVQHFCSNCHAVKPLIPVGAPAINSVSDWDPRIKQGLQQLLRHTEEGLGMMPARGGCFECSDKQLQMAVLAMLPEAFQKKLMSQLKRPFKKHTVKNIYK